jgi:aryl-alcohol dehydrogenase-like predicted oxidoreductase
MTDVSLAWLNKRCTAPVIGLTSLKRMEEALSAQGKELSDSEEAYLEEPYTAKPVEGHF